MAIAIFAACQSDSKNSSKADSNIKSAGSSATSTQCFASINNRDSAYLTLKKDQNRVSGSLSYNIYEKDKNSGVIAGIIKGDTIIADYTFQSEGTNSVRQVVWLKQNDQLIEGFGDVTEVNGKVQFKDISQLTFDSSSSFKPSNCK